MTTALVHHFRPRGAAAEETGQLLTRLQASGDLNTTTTYRVEGVSPEDLR